jgi:hypothetical protein
MMVQSSLQIKLTITPTSRVVKRWESLTAGSIGIHRTLGRRICLVRGPRASRKGNQKLRQRSARGLTFHGIFPQDLHVSEKF